MESRWFWVKVITFIRSDIVGKICKKCSRSKQTIGLCVIRQNNRFQSFTALILRVCKKNRGQFGIVSKYCFSKPFFQFFSFFRVWWKCLGKKLSSISNSRDHFSKSGTRSFLLRRRIWGLAPVRCVPNLRYRPLRGILPSWTSIT